MAFLNRFFGKIYFQIIAKDRSVSPLFGETDCPRFEHSCALHTGRIVSIPDKLPKFVGYKKNHNSPPPFCAFGGVVAGKLPGGL